MAGVCFQRCEKQQCHRPQGRLLSVICWFDHRYVNGDLLDELDVLLVFQVLLWIACRAACGGGFDNLGEGS